MTSLNNKHAFGSGLRPVSKCMILASLLVTTALTGCRDYNDGRLVTWEQPMTVQERHPIVVDQERQVLALSVGKGATGLTNGQKDEVADFLGAWRGMGGGRITISAPSGSSNEAAAYHAVADLRQILKGAGVPDAAISVDAYHDGGGKPPVNLSFVGYVAKGPECGHWPTNLAEEKQNVNYYNFGCAHQHNLAAMVANPRDLVEPRAMTARSSERRDTAWRDYVRGKSTISETQEEEKAGTISDVAKQ
jgi:pilus assembly protein CpaD